MKNGWDDILRFIFNLVTVLAILGVLFIVKLLFDFLRWILGKISTLCWWDLTTATATPRY